MIGVKDLIRQYFPKIDWDKKAKEKAKLEGVSVDVILKEWEEARNRGIFKGKQLHENKQKELEGQDNYIQYQYCKTDDMFVYNPDNYIIHNDFIYDEKPFVHPKYSLIGIPDRVIVKDGKVNVIDFKSDKAIYKTAKVFKNGRFFTKQKMAPPIDHIDYCNYMEYNLQLSFYMKLILDNNPSLRPGKLTILHTLHDEDTLEPIEEVVYNLPYLRKEVVSLLKKLKK